MKLFTILDQSNPLIGIIEDIVKQGKHLASVYEGDSRFALIAIVVDEREIRILQGQYGRKYLKHVINHAHSRHYVAAGEPLQALTYKTWALKVSIHCEGCKKKVKKVLHSVEGVYDINIDTKQQKVTVTGNIEAETLINKLVKSGKSASLWPEPVMKKEKKLGKSKKKEKQIEPTIKTPDQQEGDKDPEKEKSAIEVEEIPQEIAKKIQVNSAQVPSKGENSEPVVKNEGKKPETGPVGNQSPVVEKKSVENEQKGSGSDSKKKKNKGQKSEADAGSSTTGAPAFTESALPIPTNHSPPRHHVYEYPHNNHAPPPAYAVSYNTTHPNSSYTSSYYAAPPPYSNAYTYAGAEMQPPPSDLVSNPSQPLDSFEMFSDENPNGCFIM